MKKLKIKLFKKSSSIKIVEAFFFSSNEFLDLLLSNGIRANHEFEFCICLYFFSSKNIYASTLFEYPTSYIWVSFICHHETGR